MERVLVNVLTGKEYNCIEIRPGEMVVFCDEDGHLPPLDAKLLPKEEAEKILEEQKRILANGL